MTVLRLTLRHRPDQRLDLSHLLPRRLAGKTASEIVAIELQTTRQKVTVGDIFRLRMGDCAAIHIDGACDRLDQIGQAMDEGEIVVDGNVGIRAGALMAGGRLTVKGNVGPWAASGMKAGEVEITGNAADWLGAASPGETVGMRGGVVVVRGSGGERIGDLMRRGIIIVEGRAGGYAGSRMIAGTLILCRKIGPLPGYLMRRGTIVLGKSAEAMSPTFVDCGTQELVAMRLLSAFVKTLSPKAGAILPSPLRRFAGDMAALGKGEILFPA